jgi:hypothetical protein
MIQRFKLASIAVLSGLVLVVGLLGTIPQAVQAQDIKQGVKCGSNFNLDANATGCFTTKASCVSAGNSEADCAKFDAGGNLNDLVTKIVNILSVIVGIVAVIMIIIGGFKYITSGGDSNRVASAKNTIIYAIVGLIIVALAQVIVRFVLSNI